MSRYAAEMSARIQPGPNTTADEVLANLDLTGKRVLITGGSGGLGAEGARAMARKGAMVIVTARNQSKAQGMAEQFHSSTGIAIAIEALELGSVASIRRCAHHLTKTYGQLDILINNAGVMACPPALTEDGFELQFGTNHLGHFLLTNLLLGNLADGGRIVSLSSYAHQISPVVFDDIQFKHRAYHKWLAYGQAKTANALFAVGLNARLKHRGIEAFSVHPGAVKTDISRHRSPEDEVMSRQMEESGQVQFKSLGAGAATSVYAATAPELTGHGGAYLADCAIVPISDSDRGFSVVRSYALDPQAADQLWEVSEAMLGQGFQP